MIQLRDIETSKRILGKEDEKKKETKKIQRRVTWKDKAFIMTPMNEEDQDLEIQELSESDLEELGEKVLTTFEKAKKKIAKQNSKYEKKNAHYLAAENSMQIAVFSPEFRKKANMRGTKPRK